MKRIHKDFIYTELGQEIYQTLDEFLPYDYIVLHDINDKEINEQISDKGVLKNIEFSDTRLNIYTNDDSDYIIQVNDEYFICANKNENV